MYPTRLSKSFNKLSKCLSYLDTKKPVPTKFSILVVAKNEIDSLKIIEHKLLMEKQYFLTINNQLKGQLDNDALLKIII